MIEIVLPVTILIVLLMIGVPVTYATATAGFVGLILLVGWGSTLTVVQGVAYRNISNYLFTTIPMFILMAEFLNNSSLIDEIFETAHRWLANVRGGLAFATTLANGGMAALSGSSTASAAAMANVAVPQMQKRGYDDRLSLGTVAAAGTFAIMIPPSVGLIVYGIITETSIAQLFIAGVIPGVLTLLGYGMVIYTWGLTNPDALGSTDESYSWKEKIESSLIIWPAAIIVLLVLGGMYLGIVTPTEAGALGATGTLLVAVLLSDLRLPGLKNALENTTEITTMIFMIIIGAVIFGRYMAYSGLVDGFIQWINALPIGPFVIMLALLVVYIFMGTMMDQTAILILTLPITFPLALNLGYDPIWFGIVIVKTVEIGLVTPPLGLNVYVASGTLNMSPTTGFKGAIRFVPVDIVIMLMLLLRPEVVTKWPSLVFS